METFTKMVDAASIALAITFLAMILVRFVFKKSVQESWSLLLFILCFAFMWASVFLAAGKMLITVIDTKFIIALCLVIGFIICDIVFQLKRRQSHKQQRKEK